MFFVAWTYKLLLRGQYIACCGNLFHGGPSEIKSTKGPHRHSSIDVNRVTFFDYCFGELNPCPLNLVNHRNILNPDLNSFSRVLLFIYCQFCS